MRRIGPYTIVSELGRGAMGVVHLATDPSGRAIALKSLTVPDESLGARLLREASVRIDHPNVVRVLAAGLDAEGMPYLAMERLEGQPLSMVLREGLPTERALAIIADAARGLAAVHEKRLVHRDVKPANLFLTSDGTLKVLDFGMAAHLENASLLTATGAVVGTPAYLSPEQAGGKRVIDARSDVFSLGVVFYEALTGRRPFERVGVLATLLAVLTEAPPPLGLSASHPELEALVLSCLEKDPSRRPQTMDQLVSRIEQLPRARYTHRPAPLPLASEGTWRSIAFALFDEIEGRAELEARASAEAAVVLPLLGRSLVVVFGRDVASKDELSRALTFSLENTHGARRCVVGLGRLRDESLVATSLATAPSLHRGGLESGPLDRALVTLGRLGRGVAIDRSLSALLGGQLEVEPLEDDVSVRVRSFHPHDAPPELVGRDRELDLLEEAIERIELRKSPGLLVVGGAPGIGKTALLRVFSERARGHVAVAPAVRGGSPLASLSAGLGLDPHDREGGIDGTRVRILDRLAELLERERIVILCVDPIESLDASSRALLLDLGELFEDRALALVVAARSAAEVATSFAGRLTIDVELALAPLAGPAIARLAERILHRSLANEEATLLRDRSGGNPFFVEQLVRLGSAGAMPRSVPATLESAVQALIDGLVLPTREALMRLALLGPDAPIEHARAVLGPDADAQLNGLVEVGILHGRDTPTVLFRSRLVPEIAESLFDEEHRVRLHHELATRLSTLVPLDAEAVAHHATLGGDRGLASLFAGAALRTAAEKGDGAAVLRYLDAALFGAPPSERFALYSLAADAAPFTEEPARQRALLDAARDAATTQAERCKVEVELAERERRDGALDAAEASLVHALAAGLDPELTVRATARRALVLVSRGEPERAAEVLRAIDGETLPSASRALLWDTRGYVEGALDRLGPRRDAYARAVEDYAAAKDLRRRAGALGNLGDSMLRMGDLNAAERMLREAANGAQRVGNHLTDAYVRTNLASCLSMLGRKREALATLDAAEAKAKRVGDARLLRIQATYRARLSSPETEVPDELRVWARDTADPTLAALALTALLARGVASREEEALAVRLVTTEPIEEGLLDLLALLSRRGVRPELAEVARRACSRTLASLHEAAWRDTYKTFVRTRYDRPEWLEPT